MSTLSFTMGISAIAMCTFQCTVLSCLSLHACDVQPVVYRPGLPTMQNWQGWELCIVVPQEFLHLWFKNRNEKRYVMHSYNTLHSVAKIHVEPPAGDQPSVYISPSITPTRCQYMYQQLTKIINVKLAVQRRCWLQQYSGCDTEILIKRNR